MSQALAGETIGVLGLARSGVAAARLALAHGARVYASDFGDASAVRSAAAELRALGADVQTGGHDAAKLAACTRIVLSPGIPRTVPILADPAVVPVPVIAEVELAAGLMDAPLIAVTGTNGKTTVTSLIAHLMESAGIDAPAGGNIGTALSEVALRERAPEYVVVEVSSFQLADTVDFAPAIGVLTNLAPDHLDRYAGIEEYYGDKQRLFRNADPSSRWILNAEDERARDLIGDAPGDRFYFRAVTRPEPGELGGHVAEDGALTLRLAAGDEPLLPAGELRILGPHNIANALAAALAARLAGAEPHAIAAGLRTFEAPDHRLQPVAEHGGVLWINDSKATNIASTRVAVRSTGRPTVLLLGGRHKGEPYSELVTDLGGVRSVLAFGEAASIVERDLAPHCSVVRVDGDFEDVVRRARQIARPGDAVLLSPACSSFDMFSNYEERGRRFTELVQEEG